MAPSVSKRQGRRRLSKSSKPENFLQEQETIDPISIEHPPTLPVSLSIPQITISPPSSVLEIDSCPPPDFVYFIMFSGCPDMAFYTQSTNSKRTFASELAPTSGSSAKSIRIIETYIFDKPCPRCNPTKAAIVNENPKKTFFAFPSMPYEFPDESFLRSLDKSEKWIVTWPVVESTIPNAIRTFGLFDFEHDQDEAYGEHDKMVDGSVKTTSLRSCKMTDLMPFYVEDLRPPEEDSSAPQADLNTTEGDLNTPANDLGKEGKRSKVMRTWRKVSTARRIKTAKSRREIAVK